jgi:hypothetical protein
MTKQIDFRVALPLNCIDPGRNIDGSIANHFIGGTASGMSCPNGKVCDRIAAARIDSKNIRTDAKETR